MEKLSQETQNRIWKLKALADRGEGGEAANASELLESLLRSNGLTWDALANEPKVEFLVVWKEKVEQRLISQVAAMLGMSTYRYTHNLTVKRKRTVILEDSASKIATFQLYYDAYKKQMQNELEACYIAFLNVNRIFPETKDDDTPQPRKELTDIQRKAIAMAMYMERLQIQKRLAK